MAKKNKRILMVAAENDALPGAKVGGVGDVMRDLPAALVDQGLEVDCVIPSYGFLAGLPGLKKVGEVRLSFAGKYNTVDVLHFKTTDCVSHYIFHHPEFYKHGEQVYVDDGADRPFASDANKFAFFSACVAHALQQRVLPRPDVLHCHDWHTAFLLVLLRYETSFKKLNKIHSVLTIHNLALQGVRPITGDLSSFERWFPELEYDEKTLQDPRYYDCVNPLRAGIILADKVHTVSPTYVEEIIRESEQGDSASEGLGDDLRVRHGQGNLHGVLNGCEYPKGFKRSRLSRRELGKVMLQAVECWAASSSVLSTSHWLAERRINEWLKQKSNGFTVTSVGRIAQQKLGILLAEFGGVSALDRMLDALKDSGCVIVLGSGDPEYERVLTQTMAAYQNLIFLNGYSDALSHALYGYGDLFLMPSAFEPCGISQMLAMRSGQPCLVHAVGGLKDTVEHEKTGFVFQGDSLESQSQALTSTFSSALALYRDDGERWQALSKASRMKRFTWVSAAKDYTALLY